MITSLTIGYLLTNVSYSIRLKFDSNVFKQKASQVSFCKIKFEHQARSYGFPKTCSSPKYGVELLPFVVRASRLASNFCMQNDLVECKFACFGWKVTLCNVPTIWLSVNFDFLIPHLQRNGSLYFQLVHRSGELTESRWCRRSFARKVTSLSANLTVLAGKLHNVTFGVITRNITR